MYIHTHDKFNLQIWLPKRLITNNELELIQDSLNIKCLKVLNYFWSIPFNIFRHGKKVKLTGEGATRKRRTNKQNYDTLWHTQREADA